MKYSILITLLSLASTVISLSSDIQMLTSFALSEDKPTALLTPFLCWSTNKLVTLATTLHKAGLTLTMSQTEDSLQNTGSEHFLQHLLIIADLACDDVDTFLYNASRQGFFKAPYRWILLNLDKAKDNMKVLSNVDILVDSDVTVASEIGSGKYLLTEVYKIAESSDIIFTSRAIWQGAPSDQITEPLGKNVSVVTNIQTGTTFEKYGKFQDLRPSKTVLRRANLQKHNLTMAAVVAESNDTRIHMHDRLNLHHDSITKMTYMVIRVCFEMLNATENLLFTPTWGYKDKNGNWQGLIDHLLKKNADLGTLTIFTQERLEVIDYIAMVGSTAVRFVFREPPLAYVSNIFALPFTTAVWMAILVCVLGCSLFLYIASKWEASMGMHPLQLDGSWADVLILIIGAVLQQGCTLEPRFAAGRCVTLLLFLSLTIMYAAYSANIVVLLRAPSPSVRTLQDLLHSPLKLGASDFEYNRYFFKKLNEPIRKAIYDKKIAPKSKKPNFYSMKDGVEKIRQGLFAFHMELNPGYRLIQETYQENEKCDLVEIDYINEIDPWVPGQKRSPFKDLFKINFIKIRESGIQSCIHHRLHVQRPRCMGSINTFSSVGITDMYFAPLATTYGALLAPAILLLEIVYHKLYKNKFYKHCIVRKNQNNNN